MLRSLKEFFKAIDNTSQLCCHFARLSSVKMVNGKHMFASFRGLRFAVKICTALRCWLAVRSLGRLVFETLLLKAMLPAETVQHCATGSVTWQNKNARNLERMRTFGTLQCMRTLSCNLVYAICSASCITHQSLSLLCFNFLMIHDASLDFWMVWAPGPMDSWHRLLEKHVQDTKSSTQNGKTPTD